VRGGFAICPLRSAVCEDIIVRNNIASGVTFAGFMVFGDECGETNQGLFYNNVAHSSNGERGGYGAIIKPKNSGTECYEASHFAAYKNKDFGAFGYYESKQVIFHHMTMIDNAGGFGAALAFKGSDVYEEAIISLNDNHIYGETEVSDCPEDGTQYCFNIPKSGLFMTGITEKGQGSAYCVTSHPTMGNAGVYTSLGLISCLIGNQMWAISS